MNDREFSDIRMARDLAAGVINATLILAAVVGFIFWCVELV